MMANQKIIVKNDFQKLMILCIEPWASEFGMMPNDEFEIVGEDVEGDFYFHIVFDDERITVFIEGQNVSFPQIYQDGKLPQIYQDGKLLDYAHNLK